MSFSEAFTCWVTDWIYFAEGNVLFSEKTLISKIVTTVVLCTNEDVRAERGTKQVVAIAMADVYSALCS